MPLSVDAPSPAVSSMLAHWQLVDDAMGGTDAMRAAGKRHLPIRPLEAPDDYAARLSAATLLPAYSETVQRMAGRVFFEPLIVNDDVPGWIADEVLPDVDRHGRNLHVFAREWFSEALAYGMSHCLVESPQADGVRTREQQRKYGLRPYLIRIHPRRVLGWLEQDGVLIQLRVSFERTERDGDFGQKTIPQVRVYEPGRVAVYERGRDQTWVAVEEIPTGLNRIPLVTLYTGRTGLLTARPPLLELAHLNVKHWRMQSSIDTLLDTASVPILSISGVQDGDDVVIGAKHAVRLPPGATLAYVEHSGAAIEAGRDSLRELVDDMRRSGAKLLEPSQSAKTATQAREEAAMDNSALGGMVTQLQDTLVDILDLVGEYRGAESGGTVSVRANLDPDIAPTDALTALTAMRNAGALSDQTYFAEAQRHGIVSSDIDWQDEAERIAAQGL